jgi:hypothetical protein
MLDGLKVPTPLLVNVTDPVGVVGLEAMSLTVTTHVATALATIEPGEQVTEVVVVWDEDGLVVFRPNDPALPVWLEVDGVPSAQAQTSWNGGFVPDTVAMKLTLPPARVDGDGGFHVKSPVGCPCARLSPESPR